MKLIDLFEAKENCSVDLYVSLDKNLSRDEMMLLISHIKNEIDTSFNVEVSEVTDTSLFLSYPNLSYQEISDWDNLQESVIDLIKDFGYNTRSYSAATIRNMPNVPIHFDGKVIFFVTTKNENIKGLDKLLSCDELTFRITSALTSGILSVLKIKTKTLKFSVTASNPSHQRLFEIMKKYTTSRDILACQDELLESGLNQYAKF